MPTTRTPASASRIATSMPAGFRRPRKPRSTRLGRKFDLPLAHHHLGIALARLGEDARAIQAFETALRYQPGWAPAHRYLATLYARQPGGEKIVAEHRQQLNARADRRDAWIGLLAKLRRESAERAGLRAEARARRRADAAATGPAAQPAPAAGRSAWRRSIFCSSAACRAPALRS